MSTKKQIFPITPLVLIILDGFGLADPKISGNAITPKTAPHIFSYLKKYPNAKLKASGRDVGLFANQEGNSEAGHFNIGAGRIVKQDLVRISEAIKDGTFYKNEAFLQAIHYAHEHKSTLHVMGLLNNGQSAHAHPQHVYALLELLRRHKVERVALHLFTDGRDSSPHSAITHLRKLRKYLAPHEKNGAKPMSTLRRILLKKMIGQSRRLATMTRLFFLTRGAIGRDSLPKRLFSRNLNLMQ